jgi:hypothetical protein
MPSRYDELKAMAKECRRMAAAVEEQYIRFQLLAIAEHFEQSAKRVGISKAKKRSPKP